MNPLILCELTMCVVIVFGGFTQIIFPMLRNERLFPMFRKSRVAELTKELRQAQEELKEAKLQGEIQRNRAETMQQFMQNHQKLTATTETLLSKSDQIPADRKNQKQNNRREK